MNKRFISVTASEFWRNDYMKSQALGKMGYYAGGTSGKTKSRYLSDFVQQYGCGYFKD